MNTRRREGIERGAEGAPLRWWLVTFSRRGPARYLSHLDTARVELDAMDPTAHESTEPQFVGAYGWMRAELERRSGNVDRARAAVDEALKR